MCPLQKGQAGDTQQRPDAAEDPGTRKTASNDTGCVSLPQRCGPADHPQEGGHPHPRRCPQPHSDSLQGPQEPAPPPGGRLSTSTYHGWSLWHRQQLRAGPAHLAPGEGAGQAEGGQEEPGPGDPGTGERASDGSAVCHLGSPWPRDRAPALARQLGTQRESLTQPRGSLLSTVVD